MSIYKWSTRLTQLMQRYKRAIKEHEPEATQQVIVHVPSPNNIQCMLNYFVWRIRTPEGTFWEKTWMYRALSGLDITEETGYPIGHTAYGSEHNHAGQQEIGYQFPERVNAFTKLTNS